MSGFHQTQIQRTSASVSGYIIGKRTHHFTHCLKTVLIWYCYKAIQEQWPRIVSGCSCWVQFVQWMRSGKLRNIMEAAISTGNATSRKKEHLPPFQRNKVFVLYYMYAMGLHLTVHPKSGRSLFPFDRPISCWMSLLLQKKDCTKKNSALPSKYHHKIFLRNVWKDLL